MTNAEVLDLAREAAECAWDAFQNSPPLPTAESAYEFVRQGRYDLHEGSDAEAEAAWQALALSASDWVLFRLGYAASLVEFGQTQGGVR